MNLFISIMTFVFASGFAHASQYQTVKLQRSNILTADDSKIKSCLSSLYASQIQFRKLNGYFAALPEELKLTRYKVCDGLEISTHLVTANKFRMTAKFNQKIWSVDESKKIQPQRQD